MANAINWHSATVVAYRDVTPNVREFSLAPAGGAQAFAPGSHLQIQVAVQGPAPSAYSVAVAPAAAQIRHYSLIGQPDAQVYRIAVKRLDAGRGGSQAMWRLQTGAVVQISAPQNRFALDLKAPAYLLVAGGIGVTPLVGVAQALAGRAPVGMVYSARNESELAYLPELKSAFKPAGASSLQIVLTAQGNRFDFATDIARLPSGGQMLVCGPASMLDAARLAWVNAGRPLADLRFETFGNSGQFEAQAFRVKIPRHQLDITVPADCGLLDALEMQGIAAMYGCRRGECGLCAMDVLAVHGNIDHRDVFLSDAERAENKRICVCVSRVVGEITLDSAYRNDVQ